MDSHHLTITEDAKTGFRVELLTPARFDFYWPSIAGMMDAVPHTIEHYDKEFYYQAGMSGHVQFWAGGTKDSVRIVLATRIAIYPACTTLQIMWAAGEGVLEEMLAVGEAALERFAQDQGCSAVEVISIRRGWERVLKKLGFVVDSVILSRQVPQLPKRNN